MRQAWDGRRQSSGRRRLVDETRDTRRTNASLKYASIVITCALIACNGSTRNGTSPTIPSQLQVAIDRCEVRDGMLHVGISFSSNAKGLDGVVLTSEGSPGLISDDAAGEFRSSQGASASTSPDDPTLVVSVESHPLPLRIRLEALIIAVHEPAVIQAGSLAALIGASASTPFMDVRVEDLRLDEPGTGAAIQLTWSAHDLPDGWHPQTPNQVTLRAPSGVFEQALFPQLSGANSEHSTFGLRRTAPLPAGEHGAQLTVGTLGVQLSDPVQISLTSC